MRGRRVAPTGEDAYIKAEVVTEDNVTYSVSVSRKYGIKDVIFEQYLEDFKDQFLGKRLLAKYGPIRDYFGWDHDLTRLAKPAGAAEKNKLVSVIDVSPGSFKDRPLRITVRDHQGGMASCDVIHGSTNFSSDKTSKSAFSNFFTTLE